MRLPVPVVAAGLTTGLALCAGCASSSKLEGEMSRLRREVQALKQDLAENKVALERLDGRVALLALGGDRVASPAPTPLAQDTTGGRSASRGERVLPVVRLGAEVAPRTAPPPAPNWEDPGAVDDGGPPLVIKVGPGASSERLPVDREVLKRPDPVLSAPTREADPKGEYQRALDALRDQGRPKEALALFQGFLSRHPTSPLASNAAYWVGECHTRLGRPKDALLAYEAMLKEHPRSAKVPDALLGVAESRLELGEAARGREALEQLIDLFPTSEAAQRARARLKAPAAEGGR